MQKICSIAKENSGSSDNNNGSLWSWKRSMNTFHSWELIDFGKQIDSVEKADGFCGQGFHGAFFGSDDNDGKSRNSNADDIKHYNNN